MTAHYRELTFTDGVKAQQQSRGSRRAYAADEGGGTQPDRLTGAEAGFIEMRDSFYMATIGAGGWPYLQHRGGPRGFVRVLSPTAFAFADYRGNRQYISLGNVDGNPRAAFFFMDYVNRRRLKLLGRLRAISPAEDPALAETVRDSNYRAQVENVLAVDVEAFDWNCPQHIAPRFTAEEIDPVVAAMRARIAELERALAAR